MLARSMALPVIVVDYDPAWPAQFEQLRTVLVAALGDVAIAIEHVGSTSVLHLAAKPVIDIDVVIGGRAELPLAIERLAVLGYEHRGDLDVPGREAFRSLVERGWPRHNLYVCARDSLELRYHLGFRDWLRTHDDDRGRYGVLKRRLAVEFRHDRDAYCDAKRGFIESVLTRALGEGFCTARTVLRPFAGKDRSYAHAVFSDPEVMRFAAGRPDTDLDATARRIDRYVQIQAQHGCSKWAVFDRESGAYLGDAGLTMLPETGEIELGYRFARAHWGRGLATEVAGAWLRHAEHELGLERVIAFADPRNLASIRVMQKLGMSFDRHDRLAGMDCVVYGARLTAGT